MYPPTGCCHRVGVVFPEARVSTTGSSTILNGVASWEYEEEVFGSSVALWWSSNSSFLAYAAFNVAAIPNVTIPVYVDQPYTTTLSLPYPCPGTPNALVQLIAYDVANQASVALDVSLDGLSALDRYIQSVTWANDATVFVLTLNRAQNMSTLMACDVAAAFAAGNGTAVCIVSLQEVVRRAGSLALAGVAVTVACLCRPRTGLNSPRCHSCPPGHSRRGCSWTRLVLQGS